MSNKIKSSHRADASITIAGKRAIVKLPNTSALGYGKYHAEPGDLIVFDLNRETPNSPDVRYGRVLGRVDAAGWDGADKTPIKGYIAVMMLGERLNHAYEMWVDPANVTFCESQSSHATFFATLFNASPEHLLRMSKYGSLSTHGTCALPPTQPEEQTDAV